MLAWVLFGIALAALGLTVTQLVRRSVRERGLERQVTRLASQLDRRLTELFSLQELTYVLADAIELDAIATQAAVFLQRFISTDAVLIALKESDGGIGIVAAQGTLHEVAGTAIPETEAGLVGVAMARNRLELVNAPDQPPPVVAQYRAACAAVAPLSAHGTTIGAIAILRGEPAFDQEELRLLSSVATHATIALSNARSVELIRLGKDQWEATFDALDDGIAVIDELGRIHRANTALAQLVGRPVTDVIGRRVMDVMIGPAAELAGYLDAVRAGVRRQPITLRDPRTAQLLQVSSFPMPADAPGWLVTVVEDITERKKIESQLIQTEKMAAVGQLVSGVAHELNNPLTSISGLAEFLMQKSTVAGPERDHLRVIHEQAERAARIVMNLLTFARKGPTDVGPVDVTELAGRVVSLMTYELRLRKVELDLDLGAALPPIRGDRHQLQQVLLNLLSNAVQAVSRNPPDRPRTVVLRASASADRVRIEVEDSGPGISEDAMPHIFDPFFTTKDVGEGTGLGLSISFQIVEGHGGGITAHPSAMGGARFEVSLPVSERPEPARQGPPGTSDPRASRGRRILLVDDDPAVRHAISALLSQNGVSVVATGDATEAVTLLKSETYDAILADPRAAVSARETLADVLAARADLKDRTIFLTADVRAETDAWLGRMGVSYFRKPFNATELRAAIQHILDRA